MPPTRKSGRQPYRGRISAPSTPASVPPSGMQTMVSVTANGRCRRGTYSDDSAAAFGIAPPSPSPAKKRSTASVATLSAKDTRTVSTPNDTTLPSSAARRPIRSPMNPPMAPPIIMPTRPLVSTDANAGPGHIPLPHQRRHGGAEQLIVEAVEDDRQRRGDDQELLVAGPLAFVEQRADVNGLHTLNLHVNCCNQLTSTVQLPALSI